MDLDVVSREKGPDGRLTAQAKNARKILGRCIWCNKLGHIVENCPLGSRNIVTANLSSKTAPEDLKGGLQLLVACWRNYQWDMQEFQIYPLLVICIYTDKQKIK